MFVKEKTKWSRPMLDFSKTNLMIEKANYIFVNAKTKWFKAFPTLG